MKPWIRLLPLAVFLFVLPFPGTVALRLLTLALGLIVCAWTWHKQGFASVPAKTALLLWGGCALLSLATAIDPDYSLGEIKNEIGYTMAAYLCFITLTRTRQDANLFVRALILGSLMLGVFALWEHVSSDSAYWNERGLAGGSGSYSSYLLALLPALLWAGCVLPQKHRWSVVSGLIALQLVVAVLAGQRAFWLVFALQALFALYLLRARGFIAISASRVRAIGAAAVILSVLVAVAATLKRDTVGWTQDPRLTIWPAVAARILEHPLTGKGFGRETMKKAYPDLLSQKFPAVWHAHNLFLNYGIAMGIPGMIAILLLFFALLRNFWKLSRAEDRIVAMAGISGVLLVVGVVARNLTNDFFQRDLALLFWAIAGMLLGYAGHAKDAPARA
ncbi:MAG: O-antigen ligase family protein [Betaproteobacteria bacterium]|nr:O-antigen ligase family protein [Betaproteobacteria bacterium]